MKETLGWRRILRGELSEWLPVGQKLYYLWRAPERLELLVPDGRELLRVGYEVAEALGLTWDDQARGIVWPRPIEPLVTVLFRRLHGEEGSYVVVEL